MTSARVLAPAAAVLAAIPLLSGCGSSAVTDERVEGAMLTSFSHLFAAQQRQRALPVDESDLHPTARCVRDSPGNRHSGPGEDWVCNLTWRTRSATTGGATYSLTVRADGCFTADGDGPADLNGTKTIVAADGAMVANPLWAFDGCFPLV